VTEVAVPEVEASGRPAPSPRSFEARFDPGRNAMALLRLVLASLVIVSHAYPLSGRQFDPVGRFSEAREGFGTLAVACFFALSGYLVTGSYLRLRSPLRYAWHRCLRLFPGFWALLTTTAAMLGPIGWMLLRHTPHGYLAGGPQAPDSAFGYIGRNISLVFGQPDVRGLGAHTTFGGSFNGSLWTLRYEFLCYVVVGLLGLLGLLRWRAVIAAAFVVAWTGLLVQDAFPSVHLPAKFAHDPEILRLGSYFLAGAMVHAFGRHIRLHPIAAAAAAAALVLALPHRWFQPVGVIVLPYLVFCAAVWIPVHRADRRGDLSYGIYLYGYAVQQVLALAHIDRAPLIVYIALAIGWAAVLAACSWAGVEEPAMQLRSVRRVEGRWAIGGRATFTDADRWWLLRAAAVGAVVCMIGTIVTRIAVR
jgi:peptidoglycan/LPS O-acetylase OafA/YrhL